MSYTNLMRGFQLLAGPTVKDIPIDGFKYNIIRSVDRQVLEAQYTIWHYVQHDDGPRNSVKLAASGFMIKFDRVDPHLLYSSHQAMEWILNLNELNSPVKPVQHVKDGRLIREVPRGTQAES